jgi:hypothetical protein
MPPPATMKELLAESSLAFTGTVAEVGATTVPDIPVDERTVVVEVGEVLHAPPEVDLASGSRVTVQLAEDLDPLEPGAEAAFFANGIAYGEELAVAEVGRIPPAEAAVMSGRLAGIPGGESPVAALLAEIEQDQVVEHARGADAVVRAQVTGLNVVPSEGPPHEHDPQWWIATLHADHVAKGDLEAPTDVQVLYANSLDVRWRRHPKPKAGQGGLWLLHRTGTDRAQLAPYELVHESDLQDSILLDVLREQGL